MLRHGLLKASFIPPVGQRELLVRDVDRRPGRGRHGLARARGVEGHRAHALLAQPLHVDVHPVTCSLGVPTRHLDVRYLVYAPSGAQPVISDESVWKMKTALGLFWPSSTIRLAPHCYTTDDEIATALRVLEP